MQNILDMLTPYRPVPLIDDGSSNQVVVGTTEEGLELTVPAQPYEWWLDKDGNIIAVVISTNRCPPPALDKSPRKEDSKSYEVRYQETARERARNAGWLRVEDFAVLSLGEPAADRKPGGIKELLAERDARLKKSKARGKVYEDLTKSEAQKIGQALVEGQKNLLDGVLAKAARAASKD